MKCALPAILIAFAGAAVAQPARENTPPPKFPPLKPFDAKVHPASARQHRSMVPIPGGSYIIGSPASHPLADKLAMPEHKVTLKAFRLDRTEVTNAQFAEFLNALPVKPTGTALGGKVSAANIQPEDRAMLLEFTTRPAAYTMIDLDDAEALIGVREGRFAPNPKADNHPVTETTWAAVGKAMGEHPFNEFVNPKAKAHTEFLSKFFSVIAAEATKTMRPKYGNMYGFEEATPPNAEMVAWRRCSSTAERGDGR